MDKHTFKLEGEVVGQMSALMIATQQEKRVWIPDFERPKIKNTVMQSDRMNLEFLLTIENELTSMLK